MNEHLQAMRKETGQREANLPFCDLSVEWEQNKRAFRPGDVAKGTLRIGVASECRCRRVKVAHGWRGGWDEVPGKEPYQAPKVESVQLSQEAAESLT